MAKRAFRTKTLPDGSVAVNENGDRYYIVRGMIFSIPSDDIYNSWSFQTVFNAPERLLATYPKGGTLGFRPGTVVGSISDGCFYYISPTARHKITDRNFFKEAGRSRLSVVLASKKDIELHKEGSEID